MKALLLAVLLFWFPLSRASVIDYKSLSFELDDRLWSDCAVPDNKIITDRQQKNREDFERLLAKSSFFDSDAWGSCDFNPTSPDGSD